MIKGFIEVTNIKTDRPNLINIDWIEEVYDDNIYILHLILADVLYKIIFNAENLMKRSNRKSRRLNKMG